MAIGPEARRHASGRIVVVAGLFATAGTGAVILGLGPIIEAVQPIERALGVVIVLLGFVMLAAAASLAVRRGPARALGVAGGVALAVAGLIIAVSAADSLAGCTGAGAPVPGCGLVVGSAAVIGLLVAVTGLGCAIVVARARPDALRRPRRPVRGR